MDLSSFDISLLTLTYLEDAGLSLISTMMCCYDVRHAKKYTHMYART